jgi:hypothetical protein
MRRLIRTLSVKLGSKSLMTLSVAAGLASLAPMAALAADDGRYGDRHGRDYRHTVEHRYERTYLDHNHHDRGKSQIKVDVNFGSPRYEERRVRYWVEPVYTTVRDRVWVEPVYKTVCERVWVEPVYKTVYEEVCVPARYEVRECVRYQRGRRVIIRERVLVEPEHSRRVARNVCVSEGRWDTVERRVCVSEGHWDVVERRVCASEGRWDYRVERVGRGGHEHARLNVRF